MTLDIEDKKALIELLENHINEHYKLIKDYQRVIEHNRKNPNAYKLNRISYMYTEINKNYTKITQLERIKANI